MGKLKPIEGLVKDVERFDLVRIQLDRINEYTGYVFSKTIEGNVWFCPNCPHAISRVSTHWLDREGLFIIKDRDNQEKKYKPKGYEVLRRYKGW